MSSFDERMEELRERFRLRARADRTRLEAALQPLDREEIRAIAHGLAGTGGVFGFSEISSSAQMVEEEAESGGDDDTLRARLAELMERLRSLDQVR